MKITGQDMISKFLCSKFDPKIKLVFLDNINSIFSYIADSLELTQQEVTEYFTRTTEDVVYKHARERGIGHIEAVSSSSTKEILVNKEIWGELSAERKIKVLLHETYHVITADKDKNTEYNADVFADLSYNKLNEVEKTILINLVGGL